MAASDPVPVTTPNFIGKLKKRVAEGLDAELNRAATRTLGLRVAFVGLEFLCGIVVARVFKATGYGIYAYVVAWVGVIAIPAVIGFDRLLIREIATLCARAEWALVRGLLRRSAQIVLLLSVLLGAVVAACAPFFLHTSDAPMTFALQVGAVIVPLVALARLRQAAALGLGRSVIAQAPEMVIQPLAFLCLIGALYFATGWTRSGTVAVILYALAAGFACLVGTFILQSALPAPVRVAQPAYRTSHWIRSAMPFVWMLGMNAIMTNIDTIILGMLAGPIPAGTYRVASQMAMFVAFPLTCVNLVSASAIATLYVNGDLEGLRTKARAAARAVLIAAIPIALLLAAFGRGILGLFGEEFVAGYFALLILAGAYLVVTATGIAGYALIMTRYERTVALVAALGALTNVAGNVALIPVWGINGAAYATALSTVAVSVTFAVLAQRRLGIRMVLAGRADARERSLEALR